MDGVVYAAFGSHCDVTPVPGLGVRRLRPPARSRRGGSRSPTGNGAGIWQSGAGLTSDGSGTILLAHRQRRRAQAPGAGQFTPPSNLRRVASCGLTCRPTARSSRSTSSPRSTPRSSTISDADFGSGGVAGLPDAVLRHVDGARTSRSRWASRATCTCSTATTSAATSQGPAGGDKVVQRHRAVRRRVGAARASGRAMAAGSTSRRLGRQQRGRLAATSRLQVRPLGQRASRRCRCRRPRPTRSASAPARR